jgi:hypothetical protein
MNSEYSVTIMPASILEIIDVIGEGAALKLVKEFGGTTVRLPAKCNLSEDHPIARCIGLDLLTMLLKVIGGSRWLHIAQCSRGLLAQRNQEIVKRYSDGEKVRNLARNFHISDRQVWTILGSTAIDDSQQRLF